MPGRNLLPELASGPRQVDPAASVTTGGRNLLAPSPEEVRADRLKKIAAATMQAADGTPGTGDVFSDAITLGLQKPVQGLVQGVGGALRGDDSTFGERYSAGVGAYQDRIDKARENAGPWRRWPAEVGGTVLSGGLGGGGGPLRREAGSLISAGLEKIPGVQGMEKWLADKPITQAGLTGGAVGGIEGGARNSEDLGSAVGGSLIGMATGAPTAMLLQGLIGRYMNAGAKKEAAAVQRGPEPSELFAQSKAAYSKLDNAGVMYDMNQSAGFGKALLNALDDAKFDPGLHPKAAQLVARIERDTTGRPMTLTNLQTLRELTGDVLLNPDASERRIGAAVARTIDEFAEGTPPAMGDMKNPEIAAEWQEARKLWRAGRTAQDIGWTMDKAIRRAARSNSGQNTENAIRQNIGQVLDRNTKPGSPSRYNPAELKQMEDINMGGRKENLMRGVGNWLQSVPGAAGIAATAGPALLHSLMSGNIATGMVSAAVPLAAWGGSRMLKSGARDIAEEGVNRLIGTITRGGKMPPTWDYILQGPPTRAKLALLQMLKAVPPAAAAGTTAETVGQ